MPIQDYPVSGKPTSRLVATEVLAMLASGVLAPFGMFQRKTRTARRHEQRTVVLVHGYLANRSTLMPLGAYLRLRKLNTCALSTYPRGAS